MPGVPTPWRLRRRVAFSKGEAGTGGWDALLGELGCLEEGERSKCQTRKAERERRQVMPVEADGAHLGGPLPQEITEGLR